MNSAAGADAPRKLPLVRVLTGALTLPWHYRGDLLRNAGVPLLACIGWLIFWGHALATSATPTDGAIRNLAFTMAFLLLSSWLALTLHRMVLLEKPGSALRLDSAMLGCLGRFFLTFIAFWIVYHGVRMAFMNAVVMLIGSRYVAAGETPSEFPVSLATVDQLASAMAIVLMGRFMLLLPQIAIGGRFSLALILASTRGNALRLAVVVGALPWLLGAATDLLYRDEPTYFEWCLLQVVVVLTLVWEVVALSLSHRELMAPAPPPTDPPAPPR